jgi:hypothetical protein
VVSLSSIVHVAVAGWWIVLKHNLVLARPAAGAHFILQIYIYIYIYIFRRIILPREMNDASKEF